MVDMAGMLGLHVRAYDDVWFGVACDKERVFATTFAFSKASALEGLMRGIPFGVSFQHEEKSSSLAERVLASLSDIYLGKDSSSIFPLAMDHLSNYARNILDAVILIPVGYVSSYGLVAKAAGGGARAVGHIMATNPFAPIVPCHRVVSSDYGLGGYGGGIDVKLAFLEREKRGYKSAKEIPVKAGRLHVFPVEFVLKKLGKE